MSDTCIVCLGDLGDSTVDHEPVTSSIPPSGHLQGSKVPELSKAVLAIESSPDTYIAHLVPCGHNLHNECLKPWVDRANSCPICRQSFNQVKLTADVGGPVLSSYDVLDRTQVADVDPSMLIDDEEEESDERPCPVCDQDNNEDVLLACDGCDAYYHTYCIGLESVPPGHWFCETCETQRAIDSVCPRPVSLSSSRMPVRSHHTSDRRTRAQSRRVRTRNEASSSNWARVWQSVWDNLNLDLEFPFDDESDAIRPDRVQQRRDNREWERRLRVAERQGGANRFRETAPTLLNLGASNANKQETKPESQEELRAWNAFEKANEIRSTGPTKRKRSSATASPSDAAPTPQLERPLKRPRTRRVVEGTAVGPSAPIIFHNRPSLSNSLPLDRPTRPSITTQDANPEPSFLRSMLREIEASSATDDSRSPLRIALNTSATHNSPRPSSPGSSPVSSNHASPRARSITPPPSSPRPMSPFSLTSRVEPIFPFVAFSPNRSPQQETDTPAWMESSVRHVNREMVKSPLQRPLSTATPTRATALTVVTTSRPSRTTTIESTPPAKVVIAYAVKADLQKMVSAALKPHYQKNAVTKDEYTDINRQVSHLLYDRVTELGASDLGEEREGLQRFASEEVARAVRDLAGMAGGQAVLTPV